MEPYRTVLAMNSEVQIGDPDKPVVATIHGVSIKATSETYCVVWWDGASRREEWLYEHELRPVGEAQKMRIGFVPGR